MGLWLKPWFWSPKGVRPWVSGTSQEWRGEAGIDDVSQEGEIGFLYPLPPPQMCIIIIIITIWLQQNASTDLSF